MRKHFSDEGFMAAEWIGAVAALFFPMFFVAISIVQVPPRHGAAQMAAAEAARSAVQVSHRDQADIAARTAAADVLAAQLGVDRANVLNTIENNGAIRVTRIDTNLYCAGNSVTYEVTVPVPVSFNPFDLDSGLFRVTSLSSSSTERIDDYGEIIEEAGCP